MTAVQFVLFSIAVASTYGVAQSSSTYQTGTVTATSAVPCAKHKKDEVPQCHEYKLKTESDEYRIRLKHEDELESLQVGEQRQFHVAKNKLFVLGNGADSREQEYKIEGLSSSFSGQIFKVGKGVSRPEIIEEIEPGFSDEARRLRFEGIVVLSAVIDTDGRAKNIRVKRPLGKGLDEMAVQALERWVFKPAMKDGHPVAVASNFEINFHL